MSVKTIFLFQVTPPPTLAMLRRELLSLSQSCLIDSLRKLPLTRWLYTSSISAPIRELPKDSCFHNSWFQRHAASLYLSLKTVFHECHLIVEPTSHIHDLVLGEAVKSKYCSLYFGKMSCTLWGLSDYEIWEAGMSDRDQNLSTSQRSAIVHSSFTCL